MIDGNKITAIDLMVDKWEPVLRDLGLNRELIPAVLTRAQELQKQYPVGRAFPGVLCGSRVYIALAEMDLLGDENFKDDETIMQDPMKEPVDDYMIGPSRIDETVRRYSYSKKLTAGYGLLREVSDDDLYGDMSHEDY